MRFQTVTDLREAGFRVRIDRSGLTGTARIKGESHRIFLDRERGWLFPVTDQRVSA